MDENSSMKRLFDSIIHDETEKQIMSLILSDMKSDEIIEVLLQNHEGDGDD